MNLSIVLFGIIRIFLGVREFPSIDPAPNFDSHQLYRANSDIIESQITEPLEKAINSIDGIRTPPARSWSSSITVEFNLTKDLEEAANDVRDKVSQATRRLPQELTPLSRFQADANGDAIISMTVQSDTRSQLELSDYAENVISQRLETIPVSGVQIWGQKNIRCVCG
jgi:HAE1 family hydrophobic/amphiphilic exporter-1/multidrug efflux pump